MVIPPLGAVCPSQLSFIDHHVWERNRCLLGTFSWRCYRTSPTVATQVSPDLEFQSSSYLTWISVIAAVIQQEGPGGGLAMFLPPGDMESTDELRLTLPLHPPADAPPLPTTSSNLRAFAVRLLHRYSFAIGDTPSRFFGLTSYKQGLRVLKDTSAQKDIALLCINDDMPENSGSDQFQKTDALLREWLEDRWSTSGDWELPPN